MDTWLLMMVVSIKSEDGGSLQLNTESLMPVPRWSTGALGVLVPWGCRLGIRENGLSPRATYVL